MNNLTNMLLSVFCIGVLLFCCYGFLCTFEPLDQSVQITWRVAYCTIGFLAVAGGVMLDRLRRKKT